MILVIPRATVKKITKKYTVKETEFKKYTKKYLFNLKDKNRETE